MKKAHPTSLIYNFCKQRDWRRVEIHCRTDPIDASYRCRNEDGASPLLAACSKQPTVRVIQALLEAYPKAVRVPNSNGELPLHVACRSNASVSVLRTLSYLNPAAALCLTKTGEDAIALLLRTRDRTESHVNFHDPVLWALNTVDLRRMNYSSVFWQKVQVILEAVGTHRQRHHLASFDNLLILHAAVSLSWCPAEVLFYCCTQFPDEIRARDHRGRLPLHVAVGRTAMCRSNDTLIGKIQLREKSVVIPRLLQFFPEASHEADPTEPVGRYPLHTALLSQHEWHGGVKELLHHCPDAAMVIDPVEQLFPFQMAATYNLDTTYQLLRSAPAALLPRRVVESSAPSKEIYFSLDSILETTLFAENTLIAGKHQEKESRFVKSNVSSLVNAKNAFAPVEVVWEPPSMEAVNDDRDIVFIASDFEEKDVIPREICIFKSEEGHSSLELPSADSPPTSELPTDVIWDPKAKPSPFLPSQTIGNTCGFAVSGTVLEDERLLSEKVETEILPVDPGIMLKARPLVVTIDNRSGCAVFQGAPQTVSLPAMTDDGADLSGDVSLLLDSCDKAIHSENEQSNEPKPQYYKKYKSMITASIMDNVDHGWRKDVVREKICNFHKDPTVRIMGLSQQS